jgi:hypothetical protein
MWREAVRWLLFKSSSQSRSDAVAVPGPTQLSAPAQESPNPSSPWLAAVVACPICKGNVTGVPGVIWKSIGPPIQRPRSRG